MSMCPTMLFHKNIWKKSSNKRQMCFMHISTIMYHIMCVQLMCN